jgi:hypothetical protein
MFDRRQEAPEQFFTIQISGGPDPVMPQPVIEADYETARADSRPMDRAAR